MWWMCIKCESMVPWVPVKDFPNGGFCYRCGITALIRVDFGGNQV